MKPRASLPWLSAVAWLAFGCVWEPEPPEKPREQDTDRLPDTGSLTTETGVVTGTLEVENATGQCIVAEYFCEDGLCAIGVSEEPDCLFPDGERRSWPTAPGRYLMIVWGGAPTYPCAYNHLWVEAGETIEWTITSLYACGYPPEF